MHVRRIFPLVVACGLLAFSPPAEAAGEPDRGCNLDIACKMPPCNADHFHAGNFPCWVKSCVQLPCS